MMVMIETRFIRGSFWCFSLVHLLFHSSSHAWSIHHTQHAYYRVRSKGSGLLEPKKQKQHSISYTISFQQIQTTLDGSTTSSSSRSDLTPLAFGTPPENEHFYPFSNADDKVLVSDNTPAAIIIRIPLVQLALAGSVTTFVADMCMHPLDSIKTVQQSNSLGVGLSFLQAVEYLWNQGGGSLTAFYSGIFTYAFTDAIAGSLKFGVWEIWKQKVIAKYSNTIQESEDNVATTAKHNIANTSLLWLGAAIAFVSSSVILVPGELIKQQLQMANYNGFTDAVTCILNDKGISGFYVGYEGLLLRDIPYTMMELGLYEMFKKAIDQNRRHVTKSTTSTVSNDLFWWEEMGAAAATGAIAAFATTPLDTIKTKLMVDQDVYQDTSFADCFRDTIQQFGIWNGLFAGVEARMGWLVAYTIIYLPAYDTLKRLLQQRHLQHIQKQQQIQQYQLNILADDNDLTRKHRLVTSSNITLGV